MAKDTVIFDMDGVILIRDSYCFKRGKKWQNVIIREAACHECLGNSCK